MTKDERIDHYIEDALARLQAHGFSVYRDEEIDGRPFTAIAVKKWAYYGGGSNPEEAVFVFGEFRRLDRKKMRAFIQDAYDYASENYVTSALISFANGDLWCYPIAVTAEATDGVVREVAEMFPHTSRNDPTGYPIIFDATRKESYCFADPNRAGAFLYINALAAEFDLIDPMEE
jgi:hypothetical protein